MYLSDNRQFGMYLSTVLKDKNANGSELSYVLSAWLACTGLLVGSRRRRSRRIKRSRRSVQVDFMLEY